MLLSTVLFSGLYLGLMASSETDGHILESGWDLTKLTALGCSSTGFLRNSVRIREQENWQACLSIQHFGL